MLLVLSCYYKLSESDHGVLAVITTSSDLQLDEATRVVAVSLQGVLLVQGSEVWVGFIREALRAQTAKVKSKVVQKKLNSDL